MNRVAGVWFASVLLIAGCASGERTCTTTDKRCDSADDGKKYVRLDTASPAVRLQSAHATATVSGVWLPADPNSTRIAASDLVLRIDVKYEMQGPTKPPTAPAPPAGSFSALLSPQATASLQDDGLQLEEGWAYFWGWYPWVQAGSAHAGAEGSHFLMRVFPAVSGVRRVWIIPITGNAWVAAPGYAIHTQMAGSTTPGPTLPSAPPNYWEFQWGGTGDFVATPIGSASDPQSARFFFERTIARVWAQFR